MAIEIIDLGTVAQDGADGDVAREAFEKVNANFAEHESEIDALVPRVTTVENEVGQLEIQAGQIQGDLTNLTESFNILSSEVGDNTTDIQNLESSREYILSSGSGITIDRTNPTAPVISSTGSSGSVWGQITGELSDQLDLQEILDDKVDKIPGKQLSTEDFTLQDKDKLNSIPSIPPNDGKSYVLYNGEWVLESSILENILSLQTATQKGAVLVSSFYPSTIYGGGLFKWVDTTPKASHNGAFIVSPTVPWDGNPTGLNSFLAGAGETDPQGAGCWVRTSNQVELTYFGGIPSIAHNSSDSFNAALNYCAKNGLTLELPDGPVLVTSPAQIDGQATLFGCLKIRGSFRDNATRLTSYPDKSGTVIYTKNNSAININFNHFSNEGLDFNGVGFYDETSYVSGTYAPFPAISASKGNLDGSNNRYITGLKFDNIVAVGYREFLEFIGKVPESIPSAALLNYIGPTIFSNTNFSKCRDVIHLVDCSMNHLYVSESVWFDLEGVGIRLTRSAGGSGGIVHANFTNMVFEGMRGMLNTAGGRESSGQAGAGEFRNKLILNSCNREYCGLFGPSSSSPGAFYTGNPLGYVGNTDVVIAGVWTEDIAYGEGQLPALDSNTSTIASSVPANIIVGSSRSLSPEYINCKYKKYVLSANSTVNIVAQTVDTGPFVVDFNMLLEDGALGYQKGTLSGQTGGAKFRELSGVLGQGISVNYSDGTANDWLNVTVTNSTIYNIVVTVYLKSLQGKRSTLL